jgi:hypothetical protein
MFTTGTVFRRVDAVPVSEYSPAIIGLLSQLTAALLATKSRDRDTLVRTSGGEAVPLTHPYWFGLGKLWSIIQQDAVVAPGWGVAAFRVVWR